MAAAKTRFQGGFIQRPGPADSDLLSASTSSEGYMDHAAFGAALIEVSTADQAAPPAHDEARRAILLRSLGILDSAPEQSFDGLTDAAAVLTACPIALISLLDRERQWFKSSTGLLATETPIASSFCAHAVRHEHLFEVEDASVDPRFADNPSVTGAPHVRFYAGQPLTVDGVRLGTLCVIDTQPRRLSSGVRRALKGLAHAVEALMSARRSALELRAHQRRLADIARASGDWLWDADIYHHVQWSAANRTTHRTHDLLTEGTLLPDGPLVDGRGQTLQPSATFHSLLTRRAGIVRATIAVGVGPATRYLSFSALPQLDECARLVGFRGTSRDVSASVAHEQARYEADMALRLERDSAQRSAKVRSEMVSRVSHELRTPLNAVLGFSQILSRDTGDTPFYAAQIERAATHLLALVNDMLDLARLESGREIVDLQSVSTLRVVRRCIDLMEPETRQRGVGIAWTIAPGAEAVCADVRGLTQVLLNLLSNALKCSAAGRTVTVDVRRLCADRLTIDVVDQGPGIAAELLPALFQPFSRLSAHDKRGGTGLGLSISRALVDAMGGELSVRSELGTGSCFTVTLRAAEEDLESTLDTDFSGPLAAAGAPTSAPTRLSILYIEDDPVNALVLDRMMAHLGHVEMHHADTAAQGERMAASLKLDLIVLDMNLPDGHGLDVVRALRRRVGAAGTPIVALSADALPEAIGLALAAGFDDYLTKPIDLPALERLLCGVRGHSHATR
jgi:signal transduction histidine kinase/ActR/RegA family two-component response regulator